MKTPIVFGVVLSPLRKMPPNVFVNVSVHKVFRIGIADVAKCLFGNGFEGIVGVHFPKLISSRSELTSSKVGINIVQGRS